MPSAPSSRWCWEHVSVHEQAVGLPRQELADLAVGMAQPDRGFARVGPTPNMSNSNLVLSSPSSVGIKPLKPKRELANRDGFALPRHNPDRRGQFTVSWRDAAWSSQEGSMRIEVVDGVRLDKPVDLHARLVFGAAWTVAAAPMTASTAVLAARIRV